MTAIVRPRDPHEKKIIPNGEPVIFSEGRIGAIVKFPVLVDEGGGYVAKVFEKFARPPGTRILAIKDNKIYLQKEARIESDGYDWRLPGGKVFDTFEEFKNYLGKPIPEAVIIKAALKELQEEAHLTAHSVKFLSKKVCGATVEWDLYYVVAEGIEGHVLEYHHTEGEEVAESGWFDFATVKKMCENEEIGEGRSAAVLISYLAKAV